jgi:aerobic C4-dicarboxylate transport protein
VVLAFDWYMGMARALTNMIGNAVATVVIGAWENDIDRARVRQVLDGEIKVGLDEAAEVAAEERAALGHAKVV